MVFKRPLVAPVLAFALVFALLSCTAGDLKRAEYAPDSAAASRPAKTPGRREEDIARFFAALSEDQKLALLFLVNPDGNANFRAVEFDEAGKPMIPGGYILFAFNIADTADKTAAFIASIRKYCADKGVLPPYLAIDHEGGSVNRLRALTHPGGKLSSARTVAARYSPAEAQKIYAEQGKFLRSLGIHLNLAPVVEVFTETNRDFLEDRSYGDLETVVTYGTSAIQGYRDAGVGTVLKHFPGNTNVDPHTGLPVIHADEGALISVYIEPFRRLLAKKSAAGVLMSHAKVMGFDGGTPACLSKYWVTDVLKGYLGFDGLIISDDVYMAALEKNGFPSKKAVVSAIEAGVDVLMISGKHFLPALEALKARAREDSAFAASLEESALKVLRFKVDCGALALT
jgi:beta-N-acetylhexosaminidase